MATKITAARSAEAWRLARHQHGVLTREQLRRLGFTQSAIRHRLSTGRLHRIHPGVYAVGRRELPREGRWMAAVLACGPGALLSHGSAAALWGIGPEWKLIEVSVRRRSWPRPDGIKVRSRPSLPSQDVMVHHRIPVTTPARTILDSLFVNEFEVDFYWPDLGLLVETDSLRYHRTALKQARDLRRDQTHTAAGLTPLRFTHWQVRYDPDQITEILKATLRLRLHPAGAAGAGSRSS